MNTHSPDFNQDNCQSSLNDLIQSFDTDSSFTSQNLDLNLPNSTDFSQPNQSDHSIHLSGNLPDFSHTGLTDYSPSYHSPDQLHNGSQIPSFDSYRLDQNLSHDYDYLSVMNSSDATSPGTNHIVESPHIDIRENGHICLHQVNGNTVDVGYVEGNVLYNSSGWEVGYFKDNGDVYKYNYSSSDQCIGHIENGHIYDVHHQQIGVADTNLEGVAHLLFVVGGGVKT